MPGRTDLASTGGGVIAIGAMTFSQSAVRGVEEYWLEKYLKHPEGSERTVEEKSNGCKTNVVV